MGISLEDLNGADDLRCPMCEHDCLTYDNYRVREKGKGESLMCNDRDDCGFYAEAHKEGSLLELFDIVDGR